MVSFRRLRETLRDIQQYRELFKYLIAFLIYNDGIGTVIGVAAIYGAELGFVLYDSDRECHGDIFFLSVVIA